MVTGTLVPLEEKTVVGGLSARRYNPGKVAPGSFHSRTRVSLLTSLPFAIAQHLHPQAFRRAPAQRRQIPTLGGAGALQAGGREKAENLREGGELPGGSPAPCEEVTC